mgnify:CR=1 FL=1
MRLQKWDTMKGIASSSDLPWVCIGDFNEVLRHDEHDGIGSRSQSQIQGFRDAVDVCGLIDLGFKGTKWTYEKKVTLSVRDAVKGYLQVPNESLSDRYLGMPTDVGHSKNGTFKYLRDRVWEKVKGWMEKLLSKVGKEILIKAVAQAIPTFAMSCFDLTKGLCE